jgi:voltage-gated sodium channel
METYPAAWIFFVVFILICTFVVLNLFIAVVVRAMEDDHAAEAAAGRQADDDEMHAIKAVTAELTALRAELRAERHGAPPVCHCHTDARREEIDAGAPAV